MLRLQIHRQLRTTFTALTVGIATVTPSLSGCTLDASCAEHSRARTEPIKLADGALAATDVIEPVLVAILVDRPGGPSMICTGTRIAPGVALTAGHCVRDVALEELWVRRAESQAAALETTDDDGCGETPRGPSEQSRVLAVVRHGELDLAVLRFDEASPLPTALRAEGSIALDQRATIAGFGKTESFESGALRAIDVDVLAVEPHWITIQARGGGACTGDSGGPLYTWEERQVTLHGVLSRGSASCYGRDDYVPLVAASGWITRASEGSLH